VIEPGQRVGPEPVGRGAIRACIYGLGNLVENAVDFARKDVACRLVVGRSAARVELACAMTDPGFPAEIIDRIGEPYMSTRQGARQPGGGLGLGLFIAKTLLERSGASLSRSAMRLSAGKGAIVRGDVAA
jgi:two-component system sensor histidine kinase RegB